MSGVYEAHGFRPMWQFKKFALDWDYLCSDDLEQIVIRDRFASGAAAAITFYDHGNFVRSYSFDELLRTFRGERFLPYATWNWHNEWYDDLSLSPDHRSVQVSTAKREFMGFSLGVQEFYRFDVATGTMTRRHSTLARSIAVLASVILVTLSLAGLTLRWMWRQVKQRWPRRGFPIEPAKGSPGTLVGH